MKAEVNKLENKDSLGYKIKIKKKIIIVNLTVGKN